MIKLSLNETACRHGVSKAGLSHAAHAGRPIKGMSLHRFAVLEDGEVQRFEFPDWYDLPSEKEENEDTIFLTMKELCREHSAFHRGKIEHALRKEWPVDGFAVYEWVVLNEEGEWEGFEVPKSADFDGGRPSSNMISTEGPLQREEKDGFKQGRPDEAALSNDDGSCGKEEAKTSSKLKQAAFAAGGAAVLKSILS